MINTIFYFPETKKQYEDELRDNGISSHTISFVEDTQEIYKNGKLYGNGKLTLSNILQAILDAEDTEDKFDGSKLEGVIDDMIDRRIHNVEKWVNTILQMIKNGHTEDILILGEGETVTRDGKRYIIIYNKDGENITEEMIEKNYANVPKGSYYNRVDTILHFMNGILASTEETDPVKVLYSTGGNSNTSSMNSGSNPDDPNSEPINPDDIQPGDSGIIKNDDNDPDRYIIGAVSLNPELVTVRVVEQPDPKDNYIKWDVSKNPEADTPVTIIVRYSVAPDELISIVVKHVAVTSVFVSGEKDTLIVPQEIDLTATLTFDNTARNSQWLNDNTTVVWSSDLNNIIVTPKQDTKQAKAKASGQRKLDVTVTASVKVNDITEASGNYTIHVIPKPQEDINDPDINPDPRNPSSDGEVTIPEGLTIKNVTFEPAQARVHGVNSDYFIVDFTRGGSSFTYKATAIPDEDTNVKITVEYNETSDVTNVHVKVKGSGWPNSSVPDSITPTEPDGNGNYNIPIPEGLTIDYVERTYNPANPTVEGIVNENIVTLNYQKGGTTLTYKITAQPDVNEVVTLTVHYEGATKTSKVTINLNGSGWTPIIVPQIIDPTNPQINNEDPDDNSGRVDLPNGLTIKKVTFTPLKTNVHGVESDYFNVSYTVGGTYFTYNTIATPDNETTVTITIEYNESDEISTVIVVVAGSNWTTPTPKTITLNKDNITLSENNTTDSITATVKDQYGNSMNNQTVTFELSNVNPTDVVSGLQNGNTYVLTADISKLSAGGDNGSATITAKLAGCADEVRNITITAPSQSSSPGGDDQEYDKPTVVDDGGNTIDPSDPNHPVDVNPGDSGTITPDLSNDRYIISVESSHPELVTTDWQEGMTSFTYSVIGNPSSATLVTITIKYNIGDNDYIYLNVLPSSGGDEPGEPTNPSTPIIDGDDSSGDGTEEHPKEVENGDDGTINTDSNKDISSFQVYYSTSLNGPWVEENSNNKLIAVTQVDTKHLSWTVIKNPDVNTYAKIHIDYTDGTSSDVYFLINHITTTIRLNSISLSQDSLDFNENGNSQSITVEYDPANATNKTVTAVSNNENVVTCTVNGSTITITPHLSGTTNIVVTSEDGSHTAECSVHVEAEEPGGDEPSNPSTPEIDGGNGNGDGSDENPKEAEEGDEGMIITDGSKEISSFKVYYKSILDNSWTEENNDNKLLDVSIIDTNKLSWRVRKNPNISTHVNIHINYVDGTYSDVYFLIWHKEENLIIKIGNTVIGDDGIQLKVGETKQLTVSAESGSEVLITFDTEEHEVATVDQNGNVTGVNADLYNGVTNVVIHDSISDKTVRCKVTVTRDDVAVNGISLDKQQGIILNVGDTTTINAIFDPSNASNKNVSWSTGDENAVTISSTNGATCTILAVGSGKTTSITVTTEDGNKTANCIVTVPNASVAINSTLPEKLTVNQLYSNALTASASYVTNPEFAWSCENENVTITPTEGGTKANVLCTSIVKGAVITLRERKSDKTNTITINTATLPNSITLNEDLVDVNVGETVQLTATVLPAEADDKSVTWTSEDDTIASVDNNGLVTAKKVGEVVITATCNAADFNATCFVNVIPVINNFNITGPSSITVNESLAITYTMNPSPIPEGCIIDWVTNDKLNIDGNNVIGVSAGTGTLKGLIKYNGNVIKESNMVNITVNPNPSGQPKNITVTFAANPNNDVDDASELMGVSSYVVYDNGVDPDSLEQQYFDGEDGVSEEIQIKSNQNIKIYTDEIEGYVIPNKMNFSYSEINNDNITLTYDRISISLNETSVELIQGSSQDLQATLTIGGVSSSNAVTWSSSNENVVSITPNGNTCTISCDGIGNSVIRAKYEDTSVSCTVTVKDPTATRFITLNFETPDGTNPSDVDYYDPTPSNQTSSQIGDEKHALYYEIGTRESNGEMTNITDSGYITISSVDNTHTFLKPGNQWAGKTIHLYQQNVIGGYEMVAHNDPNASSHPRVQYSGITADSSITLGDYYITPEELENNSTFTVTLVYNNWPEFSYIKNVNDSNIDGSNLQRNLPANGIYIRPRLDNYIGSYEISVESSDNIGVESIISNSDGSKSALVRGITNGNGTITMSVTFIGGQTITRTANVTVVD